MSDNEIDMNINNYSIEDLYDILELDIDADGDEIKSKTDNIIQKFITKNKIDEVNFFLEIRNKLLERIGVETDSSSYNRDVQRDYWFQNEYSGNEPGVRDIKDSVNVYDSDTHPILNRKYLKPRGPVSQDQMNPIYTNTFSRIITIDSQYRPNIIPHSDDPNSTTSSTNYTIDLTDKLTNVTKLELYSINIPDTWFTFDSYNGNTCFWVEELDINQTPYSPPAIHKINIPSGNYDKNTLCDMINNTMRNIPLIHTSMFSPANYTKLGYKYIEPGNQNFMLQDTYHSTCSSIPLPSYTGNNTPSIDGYNNGGSLEIGISPDLISNETTNVLAFKNFNPNASFKIIFFLGNDITNYDNNINNCFSNSPCSSNLKYNQNLGWLLGYRPTSNYVNNQNGPYIKNSGEISIILPSATELNPKPNQINPNYDNLTNTGYNTSFCDILGIPLKMIYTPETFSYVKSNGPVNTEGSQYFLLVLDDFNQSRINGGAVSIAPKSNKLSLPEYANKTNNPQYECLENTNSGKFSIPGKISYLKSSIPRQLTQAQLYTVNEIKLNRREGDDRIISPNNSNVIGFIPSPRNKNLPLLGEGSGAPKINKRIYFGPVNIERLKVILIDDKGNTVNLHSSDWSFSLLATQLYQY